MGAIMSDALERVRMKGDPTLDAIVNALIGCAWGHTVETPDDPLPCRNQAVAIVVVHLVHEQRELKLCEKHRERLMAETTPHEGGGE
jgi:hypothetical protein